MEVDTSLPESGRNDFIILEEEFFSKRRLFGIANQGGAIQIGHFAILIQPKDGDLIRFELRYIPKGNYYKPESFIKRKKKPSKAKKVGEVIL